MTEATPQPVALEVTEQGQRVYEPDGEKLAEYLADRSHVSIIRGPIGSGTSTASCLKIFMHAMEQRKSPLDGKRKSRWAVVRNTYPSLTNTTLKTWLDWFPENLYGKLWAERPMLHEIRLGDIELDVFFLALDDEKDIEKLRSLELTGVWFNELEFFQKPIFDEAESRTGRYPAIKDGGSTWDGVIADLNAPAEDHWLPQMTGEAPMPDDLSEEEADLLRFPNDWRYIVQPPALLELRSPDQKRVVGYKVNPAAENIRWLKPGYYEQKMRGKTKSWIDSRLRNIITFVIDGDPVYSSFNPDTHISPVPLTPVEGHEVAIGMDFGRRPCALFGQFINNRFLAQYELRAYGSSSVIFAPMFKAFLAKHYPGYRYRIWGDPKGQDKGQADERTSYQIFESHGITVTPAPVKNNHIQTRLNAQENLFMTLHHGAPRFLMSPIGCPTLKAALSGRYRIKKGALGDPEPVKDKFSDIADCGQYVALGLGEGRAMVGLAANASHAPVKGYKARATMRRVPA